MRNQVFHMLEYAIDQVVRGDRIVDGDKIRDGIEFRERRLRPDYFSHRAMRFLAWA
jgi:hypothetical protein